MVCLEETELVQWVLVNGIRGSQRTLWLFLIRSEVKDYAKANKTEKSMLLARKQ